MRDLWPGRFRRPLGVGAGIALIVASVAACATPGPTSDPSRVLHLENRVRQAVIVSVAPRGGGQGFETALRPCGGRLDLTVGHEIPTGDDWRIGLGYDPSGSFDVALEEWTGDPHDLPGSFDVSILWSRGDIRTTDLPKWVTVMPDNTRFDTTPPSDALVPPCGALPSPEAPMPSA